MARKRNIQIPMEDEIIHTVEQPVCQNPDCICRDLEYEQMLADLKPEPRRHNKTILARDFTDAPLNGNRGFRLLK